MFVSYMSEPQNLDPAADWEGNGWSIEHCMYNTLLTYESDELLHEHRGRPGVQRREGQERDRHQDAGRHDYGDRPQQARRDHPVRAAMSFCDVVPKEWVEKQGKQFVRNPLATGAYMLDHWTPSAELVLKRNPNFFDWRGHKDARVDGIKFTFTLNPQTALLKLKAADELTIVG